MSGNDNQGSDESANCAFCGYPIPEETSPDGDEGDYCTAACAEAADEQEAFAGDLDFKQRPVDVPVLQRALPRGMPGNAAVLLSGEEGTRAEGLLLAVLWRAIERGEPAVVASVDKPPSTLVDAFLAHGWNVLPHLENDRLRIVDMFTNRLDDEEAFAKRNNRWDSFVQSSFEDAIVELRDPGDLREVSNQLDNTLEELEMTNEGVVGINNLTELGSITQNVQSANFLKEARAIFAKARYVPLFACASEARSEDLYPTEFPQDHEYLFDGIVDLELDDELIEDDRVKRLSVRKMDESAVDQRWFPYEFEHGSGFVQVDPFEGQ